MQGHRVFRVSRVFEAISDRRVIRDAKVLKGMLVHRDLRELRARQDQWAHRAISGRKVQEAFRVSQVRQEQPARWVRKV